MAQSDVFPLFFKMSQKTVLVVGSGKIATRRVHSLLRTACRVIMVSTGALSTSFTAEELAQINYHQVPFAPEHLAGCDFAIAATNDRAVNHAVYIQCKARGIPVNVCDAREECDFYFPALLESETMVGGIVSKEGNAHGAVKEIATKIREVL